MTTPSIGSVYNLKNFLVPASGQIHAVNVAGTWSGTPFFVDWRNFGVENFPFQPQGVFIDNTAGAGDLTIIVNPIGWKILCPAGQRLQQQFPAPNGQTWNVTGNGDALIVAVDAPVLPTSSGTGAGGAINVNITGPNPLPCTIPALAPGGVPYRTQELPIPAAYAHSSIAPAATVGTIVPALANQNVRKLRVTLDGSAKQAAAGAVTLNVQINAADVWNSAFYVGALGSGLNQVLCALDFDDMGFNAGAGNIVTTLGGALTGGTVHTNAFLSA